MLLYFRGLCRLLPENIGNVTAKIAEWGEDNGKRTWRQSGEVMRGRSK